MPQPTFCTHDEDFFKASYCHSHYALVYLDVSDNQTAEFIRRFLKHPAFNTQAKRLGLVARVRSSSTVTGCETSAAFGPRDSTAALISPSPGGEGRGEGGTFAPLAPSVASFLFRVPSACLPKARRRQVFHPWPKSSS